jgi:hypothetical protein
MSQKLKVLLKVHDRNLPPGSLRHCLGDGYLILHNLIYRKIRALALKYGFKFSQDTIIHYQSLPLAQLEKILRSKSIPYYDNVGAIREIIPPKVQINILLKDFPDFKNNNSFHESCHGVARTLRNSIITDHKKVLKTKKEEQRRAVLSAVEEAFANTCEQLSYAFCDDEYSKIFLPINNYQRPPKAVVSMIKSSIALYGFRTVFFTTLFSYIYSNCLYKKLDTQDLKKVRLYLVSQKLISETEMDLSKSVNRKKLKKLFDTGLNLSLGFRLLTASFCAKIYGYKQNIFSLYENDPLIILEGEGKAGEYLSRLCRTVEF